MISQDSVLRNLPPGLDRKQAIFFDGLRHAAEIADFSYRRLQDTLAAIATQSYQTAGRASTFTAAFVDAWAVVDSIDRFRSLWRLLPIPDQGNRQTPGSFLDITQAVRDIRNVADHLAQRADYIVAMNGCALGVLSWITVPDAAVPRALSCAIVPGTVAKGHGAKVPLPQGRSIELPTDLIELKAGEYIVNISEQLPRVKGVVASIERSLDAEFRLKGVRAPNPNTDILVIGDVDIRIPERPSDA